MHFYNYVGMKNLWEPQKGLNKPYETEHDRPIKLKDSQLLALMFLITT